MPAGSAGRPDQHGRLFEAAQGRDAHVVFLDVHHDHGVDHRAVGDAFEAGGALVLGQQQDVVVVGAGGRDDGGGELHDHGHVDVDAQWHDQGQDVGLGAGQGAGAAGVRVEAQVGDGGLHPGPRFRRNRAAAAQHVRHGAR